MFSLDQASMRNETRRNRPDDQTNDFRGSSQLVLDSIEIESLPIDPAGQSLFIEKQPTLLISDYLNQPKFQAEGTFKTQLS